MSSSLISRLILSRLTVGFFMAAQMLGWVTIARAGDVVTNLGTGTPPPHSPEAARLALREFDRFLDHHPLLEDELRLEPRRVSDCGYLAKNPRLREFLQANADVAVGLELYPRYFLNRALLREANAPLAFTELGPLRELFLRHPLLEKELRKNPAAIRDPVFLKANPELRDVLIRNPALARVFLPPSDVPHRP